MAWMGNRYAAHRSASRYYSHPRYGQLQAVVVPTLVGNFAGHPKNWSEHANRNKLKEKRPAV